MDQLRADFSYRSKCDRQVPCMSCSKRGEEPSCTYSNVEKPGRDRRDCGYRDSEAQLRLQKLEDMVTSLVRANEESPNSHSDRMSLHNGTSDRTPDNASIYSSPQTSESASNGNPSMKSSEMIYVNATHWTTILDNVGSPRNQRSLERLADTPRFEKSKTFWNTSRKIAKTHRPWLPPAIPTLS